MHKQLILNNKVEEVSRLETFIQELSDELSLDASLCFSLNLALEEAVVNVINYAYPSNEEHTLYIYIEGEAGKEVTFRLVDEGVPFDPLQEAPEVDTTLGVDERPIGGLGIFLIRQTMDEVSYQRSEGRNILTLTKRLTSCPSSSSITTQP